MMTQDTSAAVSRPNPKVPMQIIWINVIGIVALHIGALYGIYLSLTSSMFKTNLFAACVGFTAGIGVTAGAHRLWCHRSYKAKFPLRVFLAICHTMAYEKDIYNWCRDHRVHHKFSETDADPHNAKRGFFFCHIGWLFMKKHPDVIEKGKTVDISDVLADPIVKFQRKYYMRLVLLLWFVFPTVAPMILWGESFRNSFFVATILRYIIMLNFTLSVNSVAHLWGTRPYDKNINPSDNLFVVWISFGEGFHNYHHTFPWDYAVSEYGMRYNFTTLFINAMAWLGLAYDLKTVSPEVIRDRKCRTGELSCSESDDYVKLTQPHVM